MMWHHDPPRLLDPKAGSPKLLRDALRAGRDDVPRPDELERMAVRLAAAVATPPVEGPTDGSSVAFARALWKWPIMKFGGPMLLAAAIGGSIWMAGGGGSSRFTSKPPVPDNASSESISAEPPHIRPAPVVEVRPTAEPDPSKAADPSPARRSVPQDKPAPAARPPQPAPAGSAAEPAGMAPVTGALSPQPAPVEPAPRAADPPEADAEVHLLHKAQDEAEANPQAALVRVAEHERRFASGLLVQEREVIAITALMRLGRTGEARDRAAAFRGRFPGSAYVPRIDALLARKGGAGAGQ